MAACSDGSSTALMRGRTMVMVFWIGWRGRPPSLAGVASARRPPSARLCGAAESDPSPLLCVMSEKRVCGAPALGRLLIARPKRPSMRHFGCDGVTLDVTDNESYAFGNDRQLPRQANARLRRHHDTE